MRSKNISQLICFEQEIVFIEKEKLRSLLLDTELFSNDERRYCHKKPTPLLSISGLWCAKRAFIKATCKLKISNFNISDLQIAHHASGQPIVLLHGSLARWFKDRNIAIEVSIAHTATLATAGMLFGKKTN
jgi:holo-[acyl-carrier protein] synthase